jgi:hypothetical protein
MINPIWSRHPGARKEWLRRFDRTVADLNVLLVAFAIGLAVLDATCLVTQQVIEQLPPVTSATYARQASAPASLPNRTDPR